MPDVEVIKSEPFSGWTSFLERCRRVGGRRGCLVLSTAVAKDMEQNEGIFIGDAGHNFANHTLLSRILLRVWLDELAAGTVPADPLAPEDLGTLKALLLE